MASGTDRDDYEARWREINRRFYREHAATFDATRGRPWSGWSRALGHLEDRRSPSILDVGCGNGRLADVVHDRLRGARYLGIDSCLELLSAARLRPSLRALHGRLLGVDALTGSLPIAGELDAIAVFGFLHHVPSLEETSRLLHRLFGLLSGGGVLMVSFWQFAKLERFRERSVAPTEIGLPAGALGPGDFLLPWQRVAGAVRFCHHSSPEEAERLVEPLMGTSGGELVDRFSADGAGGDLNLYFVLRRPDSPRE